MKKKAIYLMLILSVLFTSCADVVNIDDCVKDETTQEKVVQEPYGFWFGLWHGFVSPFSFIGSLFDDDIAFYGINNNGNWYNLGFVLGSGIISGGASITGRRRRK